MSELTLLIVDDEESIRRSLVRTLRHEGYRILKASNAFEAMAILSNEKIHVILSDFKMPLESGFELLEKVKKEWPHVTRIMLTAYTNSSLLVDAINKGLLFRFIDKPWNSVSLKNTIREAMDHSIKSSQLLEKHLDLQKELKELKKNAEANDEETA